MGRNVYLAIGVAVAGGLAGCGSTMTVTQTATVTQSTSGAQSTTAAASATATQTATQTALYSGVAPNANYGPATDQSGCPGTQVTVGPDTSCPFAANVAKVVSAGDQTTGHFPASVIAFSPVTGKSYRLRCSILGYGECRHLQWPRGRRLKWPHLASVVVGLDLP